MTRIIAADLKTGTRWNDVPFKSFSYNTRVGAADSITVTVTLDDPEVAELDLRSSAAVGKSCLGVVENDVFMAAGPVWDHSYDADTNELTITATGWESYFAHRYVLPALAADQNMYPIILPEDIDGEHLAGDSNPALATSYSGFDYGTLGKKLAQQALAWPGSPGLFVFPDDVAGTRSVSFTAAELKVCYDALTDITGAEDGPDIFWETRWRPDRLGVEVVYRAGTELKPRVASETVHRWDNSVIESSITGLKVDVSGSALAGQAWVSGGRSTNEAIIRRGYSSTLTDAGFALFEKLESRTTTSTTSELDSYANELVRVGSKPTEFWSFDVKTDVSPIPGEYSKGDYCTIIMPPGPYIPQGEYQRRIMGLASTDDQNSTIKITTAEV